MSTATTPGTHHTLTSWPTVAAPTKTHRTPQTPRGFWRVKLALTQTSAHRTPEAPQQAVTTRPGYDADRGISGHVLTDSDDDSRHTIAAKSSATQWYYPPEPDLKWRPGRLDAIMAAAAIGIGIVSGLTAGSAMWWATGEHPHLVAFGAHLHHGSPRS